MGGHRNSRSVTVAALYDPREHRRDGDGVRRSADFSDQPSFPAARTSSGVVARNIALVVRWVLRVLFVLCDTKFVVEGITLWSAAARRRFEKRRFS